MTMANGARNLLAKCGTVEEFEEFLELCVLTEREIYFAG